jgi:serine/threonine protein kinase
MTVIKSEYQLTTRIHEDEFACIYKAISLKSHAQFLVWEYKKRWMTPVVVHDMVMMVTKLKDIHHPSIMNLIDYHVENDCFFAIYPHEDGLCSLEDLLKVQSVGMTTQWTWIEQLVLVCQALEVYQVPHGNINFNTIWIDSQYNIKITGIGLNAQILKHHAQEISGSDDAILLAPETVHWGEITPQSDMYSVAMIMHVLFYQDWPYPYTEKIAKLQKYWGEGRIDIEKPENMPQKVADVIDIALELLPSRRFTSWSSWITVLSNPAELTRIKEKNKITQEAYVMSEYSKRKQPGSTLIRLFGSIIAIAVIGLTIATLKLSNSGQKEGADVTVPNVVGMTVSQAQQILEKSKLQGIVSVSIYHYNVPEGRVIESKPKEGMLVKESRTVKLIISKGKGDVVVPDISGRNIRTATEIAQKMGLNVIVQSEVFSYDQPKGTIISQYTTPNETVSEHSDIRVTVSKGIPLEVQVKEMSVRIVRGVPKKQREVSISFDFIEGAGDPVILVNQVSKSDTKVLYQRQFKTTAQATFTVFADVDSELQILVNGEVAQKVKIEDGATAN